MGRRIIVACAACMLAAFMASCDNLFSNYFRSNGLGQPDPVVLAELPVRQVIQQYAFMPDGGVSPQFLDTLAADEQVRTVIVEKLEQFAATESDPAQVQDAQSPLIELKLDEIAVSFEDDGARAISRETMRVSLRDLYSRLQEAIRLVLSTDASQLTPEAIVDALVPAPLQEHPEAFAELIDRLAAMSPYFDRLSQALVYNGIVASRRIDIVKMAQLGAICKFLNISIHPSSRFASIGAAVATLVTEIRSGIAASRSLEYYFTGEPDFQSLGNDYTVGVLFCAAGMQDLLEMFRNSFR